MIKPCTICKRQVEDYMLYTTDLSELGFSKKTKVCTWCNNSYIRGKRWIPKESRWESTIAKIRQANRNKNKNTRKEMLYSGVRKWAKTSPKLQKILDDETIFSYFEE